MPKLSIQTLRRNPKLGILLAAVLSSLIGLIVYNSIASSAPPVILAPKNNATVSGFAGVGISVPGGNASTTGKLSMDGTQLPGNFVGTLYGIIYKTPDGLFKGLNMANFSVGNHVLVATVNGVQSAPITIKNTGQVKIAYTNTGTQGGRTIIAGFIQLPQPPQTIKLLVDGVSQPGTVIATPYGWVYKHSDGQWGIPLTGSHSLMYTADGYQSDSVTTQPSGGPAVQIVYPSNGATNINNPVVVDAAITNGAINPQLKVDGVTLPGFMIPTIYGWIYQDPSSKLSVNLAAGKHTLVVVSGSVSSSPITITVSNPPPPPPPSSSTNSARLGITLANNAPGISDNQAWDQAKAMGFGWIRTDMIVSNYSDLTAFDGALAQARRTGLKIDAIIDYAYSGLGTRSDGHGAPLNPQAWANYAGSLVAHWNSVAPGAVGAVEVWNEENNDVFWSPVNPNAYADLLHRTYLSIKSQVPNMTVIMGGLSPGVDNLPASDSNPANSATFLADIYAWNRGQGRSGSAQMFDAATNHPYQTWNVSTPSVPTSGIRVIHYMREVMNANGDQGKQIWNTEAGWPSCYQASGNILSERDRATAAINQLNDIWYGKHLWQPGSSNDGATVTSGTTLDWNTGPYFAFKLYKSTEGDWEATSYGLIYSTRSQAQSLASHIPGGYADAAICANPPSDYYQPPVVQAIQAYAAKQQ